MKKIKIYIDGKEMVTEEFIKKTGIKLPLIEKFAESNIPMQLMDGRIVKIIIEK